MYILNGKTLDFSEPHVMAIINVTPDSFYDGGKYNKQEFLEHKIEQAINEGASIIDIGGYSTRPGAIDISIEEEIKRVLPAIKITKKYDVFISLDTFRSEVAKIGIAEGVDIINDVSGGELDTKMYKTVANHPIAYVCMHMRGNPRTMESMNGYNDIVSDVYTYFERKITTLEALNIKNIILDVGFGFAKTTEQSFELLRNIDKFKSLNYPLLVGVSRKSMIYKTLQITPQEALNGTTVLHTIGLQKGGKILRVHDVKEAVEVVRLCKLS